MRVVVRRAGAVLASAMILMTLPAVEAQEGSDPRATLGAEQNVLWAHKDPDAYFMSAMKDDPDGTVAGAGYNPLGYPLGTPGELTWVFPMRPALANDVTLGDEDVVIEFHVGGCIGPEGGVGLASTELTAGGTTVAQGEATEVVYAPEGGTVTWSVPAQVDSITAGTALTWTVHLQGASGQACASFTGDRHSSIALPVMALPDDQDGGFSTITEDLEDPRVSHTFANATSDTYILNFTTDVEDAVASFAWNATEGSVNATLFDGNGTEVFAGSFTGEGAQEETLMGVVSGDWNLTLEYNGFNGTFAFDLAEYEEDTSTSSTQSSSTSGSSQSSSTSSTQGNGTGNETLDDSAGQESPGLPLLVPLGVVAIIAARRRNA